MSSSSIKSQEMRRVVSAPELRDLEKQRQPKRLSFGTIEVRSYEVVRGHPEIEMAHPLSLGWECVQKPKVLSVDDYETTRPPRVTSANQLRTNVEERSKILKKSQRRSGSKRRNSLSSLIVKCNLFPMRSLLTVGGTN
ncbi:expressed unknown protein [Seminavis robusta]|uniref:Uncharacterized protein n=1 Tax=Seminavis robusta TaxID=568900 RepID=A0A9N8H3C9_9STRA|nr:expressed unknown protein [Seminavis robusta]|eukprot:Sro57_g033260.1 n/a (138) ;mRNA; f:50766-51179